MCLCSSFSLVNFSCFQCLICNQEQTDPVKTHFLMYFSLYAILNAHDDFSFQGFHFFHSVKRTDLRVLKIKKAIAWKVYLLQENLATFTNYLTENRNSSRCNVWKYKIWYIFEDFKYICLLNSMLLWFYGQCI